MANGIDFFVDTNVLIYALEKNRAVAGIIKCTLGISVMSEVEMLGKKNITRQEVNAIRYLLNDCEIIDFSDTIKDIAISLKQKYSIKALDAIIAATAKAFSLPLITADKDFKKIEDIEVVLLDLNR